MTKEEISSRKSEIHREICAGLTEVYARKNADYGDSFGSLRKEYPESICVRLGDKYNRLKSLLRPGYVAKVADEKVEDTLLDLANYAIMELVERRIDKELGQE